MNSAKINGKTKIVGLFGYPVEHTFSPLMHNSAFEALKLDYVYVPFPVAPENLAQGVEALRALGLQGVNVTIPHKEAVMEYLDEISPQAKLIGAVNTIVHREGKLIGYNTDGPGFVKSLEEETGTCMRDKSLVIIGAGGAARAVAIQSALAGARKISLVNRNPARADSIAESIQASGKDCLVETFALADKLWQRSLPETNILVDTSPIGMHPHTQVAPIISPELLSANLLVCDLVYNPQDTVLLQAARASGAKTWGGLGMLIHQGALAFELWTGQKAPLEVMEKAVQDYLSQG